MARPRLELSLLLGLLIGCSKGGLAVPPAGGPITCDGETSEPGWRTPARSGLFRTADGHESVAAAQALFLADDQYLYLMLLAGDGDIRSSDAFDVDFGPSGPKLHFAADGKSPRPDVRVGIDMDGTLDDTKEDEQWNVEAAVPRALLPGKRVPIAISRCDAPTPSPASCGSFRATLVLP